MDKDNNTGDRNAGNYNTGNYNTGFFNTKTSKKIKVFNKPCLRDEFNAWDRPDFLFFRLTQFISIENMSESEKESNPDYKTIGGYLKSYEYKEAFKKSWDEADKVNRLKIKNCPNFDADIFFEISGIRVEE